MSNSKSGIELYHQCKRAYKYTYIDGYETTHRSPEQAVGLAVHRGLQDTWMGNPIDAAAVTSECTSPMQAATALAMLRNVPTEPLVGLEGTEIPFKVDRLGVHGIFDGIKITDTEVCIVEHKTTRSDLDDGMYWERVKTDWQVGIYLLAAEFTFGKPAYMLYNVMRVPGLRHRRGESDSELLARIETELSDNPEKYYRQARITWKQESLARLEADLLDTEAAIKQSRRTQSWPRSRRCFPFPRQRCGFYPVCFEGAELADNAVYQIRRAR